MKISLGRTVHYQTGEEGAAPMAAIVARVIDEETIEVAVFNPTAGRVLYTRAREVSQGESAAGWYWPPHVE